ncbi:MAG: uroporphyrinogen-III C-methyltransferase [Parahaliea sp.]
MSNSKDSKTLPGNSPIPDDDVDDTLTEQVLVDETVFDETVDQQHQNPVQSAQDGETALSSPADPEPDEEPASAESASEPVPVPPLAAAPRPRQVFPFTAFLALLLVLTLAGASGWVVLEAQKREVALLTRLAELEAASARSATTADQADKRIDTLGDSLKDSLQQNLQEGLATIEPRLVEQGARQQALSDELQKVRGLVNTQLGDVEGYVSTQMDKVNDFVGKQMDSVQTFVSARTGELDRRLDTELTKVDELINSRTGQLESLVSTEAQKVETLVGSRMQALQSVVDQTTEQFASFGSDNQERWLLAEAQYLTRQASQRLLIAGDVASAEALLGNADNILVQLDDERLADVRASLGSDIATLQAVPRPDVDGIYERLVALSERVSGLSMTAADTADTPSVSSDDASWKQRLREGYASAVQKLSSYVVVRRRDKPVEPLMDPQWEALVQQNLYLLLNQAQVALLSANEPLYQQSLERARRWLSELVEADEAAVQAMDAELSSLLSEAVVVNAPDISASLQAMEAANRAIRGDMAANRDGN